jgi:antitoxin YefM
MTTVSFSEFRKNLAKFLDLVQENFEEIVIMRSKGRKAVLLSHDEYSSMMETCYLLSTEKNQKHLAQSIQEHKEGKVVTVDFSKRKRK